MSPKDKAFKKLQAEWYEKLEKEGFRDIEQDEDTLKGYASVFAYRHTHEEIEEKQRYHDMANAFLEQYKFETRLDQVIWEYHCNNLSGRKIAKLLKKVRIKTTQQTVDSKIKKLKTKMFDMLWAPLKAYYDGNDE